MNSPSFIYGTAWKEAETARLTREAIAAGFRAIDTANQRKHYFEAAVGEALLAAWDSGQLSREATFLQTKFTYQRGQDHRLPYDPEASFRQQVRQSFQSSLEHLHTDYLDSYLLHGPASGEGLLDADWEVWSAMEELHDEGKVKHLGVSNMRRHQLDALLERARIKPSFVQNRCYAKAGWDAGVRALCRASSTVYQGFSLLTANRRELATPEVREMAAEQGLTVPQLTFAATRALGILPLTGTSDPLHMRQDLDSLHTRLDEMTVDAWFQATTPS